MKRALVLFVDKVEQVNRLVETGISVGGRFEAVLPQPSTRVTLIVPPFISEEFLARDLARFGKIVSPIRKVLSGCKSPLLKHVVSHRRQVYMILNNRAEELNVCFHVKVEDFDYMLYASSSVMKCFGCGEEGHLIRACLGRAGSVLVGSKGWDPAPDWPGAGNPGEPEGDRAAGPEESTRRSGQEEAGEKVVSEGQVSEPDGALVGVVAQRKEDFTCQRVVLDFTLQPKTLLDTWKTPKGSKKQHEIPGHGGRAWSRYVEENGGTKQMSIRFKFLKYKVELQLGGQLLLGSGQRSPPPPSPLLYLPFTLLLLSSTPLLSYLSYPLPVLPLLLSLYPAGH
ncbi:Transposon TX1 uncharacterized 82 kDa protein ORF 1 [Takifugu flavidus]|uniref:Transposon TX1 uncharacterized 82 kDa protein ORF 1 n=1 Tax=Takifugu flavidus TaxID=433684 RepID=A0A5C6PH90_9TELE|nr:Transposon TX1 uncharacterized 82 kDa protein ORF 1 [Takifugu flavidus]